MCHSLPAGVGGLWEGCLETFHRRSELSMHFSCDISSFFLYNEVFIFLVFSLVNVIVYNTANGIAQTLCQEIRNERGVDVTKV